jgi:transcriptional regulator with XRE-family HTH domain
MTSRNTSRGASRDWLLKAADIEDACRSVSVGGLAVDFGMPAPGVSSIRPAFGRLVEFARRDQGLTVEELAERAGVDLAALLEIENDDRAVPEVKAVHRLAQALHLPRAELMELAGLATPKPEISRAALKFAARSEPTSELTRDEREALEEFVTALTEASDGA